MNGTTTLSSNTNLIEWQMWGNGKDGKDRRQGQREKNSGLWWRWRSGAGRHASDIAKSVEWGEQYAPMSIK